MPDDEIPVAKWSPDIDFQDAEKAIPVFYGVPHELTEAETASRRDGALALFALADAVSADTFDGIAWNVVLQFQAWIRERAKNFGETGRIYS
jgi:hypothetical protein